MKCEQERRCETVPNMLIPQVRGRLGYVEAVGHLDKTSFSQNFVRKQGKKVKHRIVL